MAWYEIVDSPLGPVFIGGSGAGLHRVEFLEAEDEPGAFVRRLHRDSGDAAPPERVAGTEAAAQVRAYFEGRRRPFDLPLAPRGTAFQQRVWLALREIPPGETRTYGAIARAIGHPTASRAVGAANGRNPLAIVVPCHRVIGSDGTLTGYASGLERKRWLLEHERTLMPLRDADERAAARVGV